MKLEHGKTYVTKGGYAVEIEFKDDDYQTTKRCSAGTTFNGFTIEDRDGGWFYRVNGTIAGFGEEWTEKLTIVEEIPPIPDPPAGYEFPDFPQYRAPKEGEYYIDANNSKRVHYSNDGMSHRRYIVRPIKLVEPEPKPPRGYEIVTDPEYIITKEDKLNAQANRHSKKGWDNSTGFIGKPVKYLTTLDVAKPISNITPPEGYEIITDLEYIVQKGDQINAKSNRGSKDNKGWMPAAGWVGTPRKILTNLDLATPIAKPTSNQPKPPTGYKLVTDKKRVITENMMNNSIYNRRYDRALGWLSVTKRYLNRPIEEMSHFDFCEPINSDSKKDHNMEGYVLLEGDEILKEGDEFLWRNNPAYSWGKCTGSVGTPISNYSEYKFRRPIESKESLESQEYRKLAADEIIQAGDIMGHYSEPDIKPDDNQPVEKKTTETPSKFRFLEDGEIIQEGDLVQYLDEWLPVTSSIGFSVPTGDGQYYKRPVSSNVEDQTIKQETEMKSETFVKTAKTGGRWGFKALNYFVFEPAVNIGKPLLKSLRYAIFAGLVTAAGYGYNNPTAVTKFVSSCLPNVSISAPEILK